MSNALTAATHLRKAQRALRGANLLLDGEDWEGACARAYYVMYDAAHAALLLVAGDRLDGQTKTHRGLIGAFGQLAVQAGHVEAELGRSLNQVHQVRLLADYTGEEIGHDDASWAIEQAKAFLSAVQTLFDKS